MSGLGAKEEFREASFENPHNRDIVRRLASLQLPQAMLTAGCLFQTIWNQISGAAPGAQIKDYDVFYFDESDLSWEAEDAVIQRAAPVFADLGVTVEVRNQARVHLWFRERFGTAYPRLRSAREGVDRFLIACTCVGIEAESGCVYAPHGVGDVWAGRLAINPIRPEPLLFRAKAADYKARWPWLKIMPPPEAAIGGGDGS